MVIGSNIRFLRRRAGYSQPDLAKILGYTSFTTIQKWESGISTPPLDTFIKMADLFGVDMDDFATEDLSALKSTDGITQSIQPVPIIGMIPADNTNEAADAAEDREYVIIEDFDKAENCFALIIRDGSMRPKYEDGDIVVFERCPSYDNGGDCAVRLPDSASAFRKLRKTGNGIVLQPINPEFEPIQISGPDAESAIEIIGIAREIRRRV